MRAPQIALAVGVMGVLIGAGWALYKSVHSNYNPVRLIPSFNVSPDGNTLIFTSAGKPGEEVSNLYLLDLRTRRVTVVGATAGYETSPSFSPDGASIVYVVGLPGERADHLFVRDLRSNTVRQLTSDDANICSPTFFRDGKRILFARDTNYQWGGLAPNWGGGGSVWSINRDGTGLRRMLPSSIYAWQPRISQDGKTLLWWHARNALLTAPANGTGQPRTIVNGHPHDASFSPDGKWIVYIANEFFRDSKLCVVAAAGGQPRVLSKAGQVWAKPTFSPNGRTIFYIGSDLGLWRISTDGTHPVRIAGADLFESPLTWRQAKD